MKKKVPPSIKFFEEESLSTVANSTSGLTKIVRFCSFGLIKTDTQAGTVVVLLVLAGAVGTYVYVQNRESVAPTVQYEILPQESIGSTQGLSPLPNNDQ